MNRGLRPCGLDSDGQKAAMCFDVPGHLSGGDPHYRIEHVGSDVLVLVPAAKQGTR
jgi:hypothetical protein